MREALLGVRCQEVQKLTLRKQRSLMDLFEFCVL